MFTIKIYKYDSTKDGYRGEDFSRFLSQGQDITEDITQILDTSEITLFGLTTKTAFEPETKFIIDILLSTLFIPHTELLFSSTS